MALLDQLLAAGNTPWAQAMQQQMLTGQPMPFFDLPAAPRAPMALAPPRFPETPVGAPAPVPSPQAEPQPGYAMPVGAPMGDAMRLPPPETEPTAPPQPRPKPTSNPQPAPVTMPEADSGFSIGKLGAILAGAGGSDTVLGAIGGAIQGGEAFDRRQRSENLTLRALRARGIDAETAQLIASDPKLAQAVIPTLFGGDGRYGKAGSVFQGPDGVFYSIQFGGDGSRRIEPIVVDGKPLSPARGVSEVDTGTGTRIIDKATGRDVREIDKNLAGAERQKIEGRTEAERLAMLPKARSALRALDASQQGVLGKIDDALPKVNGWTAGLTGTLLKNIPGTAARDVQELIKTIKANIGFDKLQEMRDNSPTGGALGQVAVQELEMLQAVIASLEQAQSPEQLKAALEQVRRVLTAAKARRQQAFVETFGNVAGAVPEAPAQTQGQPVVIDGYTIEAE